MAKQSSAGQAKMPDYLAIIDRVVREHERIRVGMRAVGESTNDIEAVFSLQQASAGWSTSSLLAFGATLKRLEETLASLAGGLDKHFRFEEEAFPALLGDLLMRAVLVVHGEIDTRISFARSLVRTTSTADMAQPELLAQKSRIQMTISGLNTLLEEHGAQEETVLSMLKKLGEDKK